MSARILFLLHILTRTTLVKICANIYHSRPKVQRHPHSLSYHQFNPSQGADTFCSCICPKEMHHLHHFHRPLLFSLFSFWIFLRRCCPSSAAQLAVTRHPGHNPLPASDIPVGRCAYALDSSRRVHPRAAAQLCCVVRRLQHVLCGCAWAWCTKLGTVNFHAR